jgi:RNA-directed DNA polymerase
MVQPAHWQALQRSRGSRMSPDERRSGVTPAEQRGAQSADHSMATSSTRRGGATTTTGIAWRAQRARSQPATRFTALMHHCTVDNLRAGFEALDGTQAPGVDGMTTATSGPHLERHRHRLHTQLHQMSYRPHPVRRGEMPQEDGTTRPLGMSGTEDKSVQDLARRLLEAISEPVCLETS